MNWLKGERVLELERWRLMVPDVSGAIYLLCSDAMEPMEQSLNTLTEWALTSVECVSAGWEQ
jgi:hypothetical protein